MPRLKILQVLEATLGGTRRHVTDLLLGLNKQKYEIHFAFSRLRADDLFAEELQRIQASGVRCFEIPMTRKIRPVSDLRSLWQLYRLARRERYDLVHTHSSKAGFLGRTAAKMARSGCRTLYTPNAIAVNLHPFYGWLERVAGLWTDAIIAVSESEREEIAACRLVPPSRLAMIFSGIDLTTYSPAEDKGTVRSELAVSAETLLIGAVGRLAAQKDPQTFVRTAEAVLRRHPQACFVWVGEGELNEAALSLARTLGVEDRIRFVGFRRDVPQFLRSLDIFVLTSTYESFGYVTCEAMALGKPVVATAARGTRDLIVPGTTGFLTPLHDVAALSDAICTLIEDPDLRRRMGSEGRRRAEEVFNVSIMVKQTEDLYDRLSS